MNEDSSLYEIGFHIVPSLEEVAVEKVVDAIKGAIKENGGSIVAEESPKITNLAYQIMRKSDTATSRFDKAFFGWIKFELPRDAVAKIYDFAKANKDIIRFIVVKTERANAIHFHKIISSKKEDEGEEVSSEVEKINEEEIDKTIENLVV